MYTINNNAQFEWWNHFQLPLSKRSNSSDQIGTQLALMKLTSNNMNNFIATL